MGKFWKEERENIISREVKRESYERVMTSTIVCGSEMWSLSAQEIIKI